MDEARKALSALVYAGEPASADALLQRARALAGRTLGELAEALGVPAPSSTVRGKGWAGHLVERALGSGSGSRPEADFASLGIELKTVPVDVKGRPRESTFVTTLDLDEPRERVFETSRLWAKLAHVLWVPIEADKALALARRRVGWAVLWRPSPDDARDLREDFEALVELHEAGLAHRATARNGRLLQLRPKGANSRALRWGLSVEGEPMRSAPQAFYLRATFTRRVLADAWISPTPT